MNKVEEYIENYTRKCSNELTIEDDYDFEKLVGKDKYVPWMTPDNARAVAQIARKEILDKLKTIVDKIDVDNHDYEELEDLYDALCEMVK